MDQTFHTLIHAGAKTEVEELAGVRRELGKLLGKEFVIKSDTDYSCLNKVVCLFIYDHYRSLKISTSRSFLRDK